MDINVPVDFSSLTGFFINRHPKILITAVGILWILQSSTVYACSIGLTQLRYRSLQLMYCIPPSNSNESDPCPQFVNGQKALCQKDEAEGQYICCGAPELLIDLLSSKEVPQKVQNLNSSTTGQSSDNSSIPFPRNHGFQYSFAPTPATYLNYGQRLQQLPPYVTATTAESTPLNYRQILQPVQQIDDQSTSAYNQPQHRFNTAISYNNQQISDNFSNVSAKTDSVFNNNLNAVQNSAPILSLITNPYYATGNINNTWTTTSIVVLVQDGPCSIVINTGLPIQKNEIVANLAAKGIVANKLDYTVITSGFPQFIGNANLFPTSQFIVGQLYAHWSTVALSRIATTPFVNLCSSKTQIMRTPGPSPDSISVIVRNVPMMGTVAITGALFVQDIDVNRIDSAFVWDTNELYTSRRKVICISDWIIPGHSAPVQVTEIHKRQAQCPEIYN